MTQIFKHILFLIAFFTVPYHVNGQQKSNHSSRGGIPIAAEVLFTRDYTNRVPINGPNAWAASFLQPALNLSLRFKSFGNLHLEAGYRYKEHWFAFEYGDLLSTFASVIAESHSIPLRAVWEKNTKNKRWNVSISGGIMGTYLTDAYSKGYMLSGITKPTGKYLGEVFFEEKDRPHPHFIPFLDGALRVNFRLYKKIYLTLGYGGSKGFHNLSEGRYTLTGPDSTLLSSGKISQVGSYSYWILGLNVPLAFNKYGS